MKRNVKIFLDKSIESLLLCIELFNSPHETGRKQAVLILLDHAFEMLLKASLLHKGCNIIDKKTKNTIGFASCLRKGMGDGTVKFLNEERTLTLQTINSMRDAEMHYFIDISEQQLYFYVQSGFTLFQDILMDVFQKDLYDKFPKRVLPISTKAPESIEMLYKNELEEIKKLLGKESRKKELAIAKLRSLEILERSLAGDEKPITEYGLKRKISRLLPETSWEDLFPNVASINMVPEITGPSISLRITKKEGIPIQLVKEGTPGMYVVGVKRVDELGFYNMGRDQLAKNTGLTIKQADAVIWYLNLKNTKECCKHIPIGNQKYYKYSQKAIDDIKKLLESTPIDEIWNKYREYQKLKH